MNNNFSAKKIPLTLAITTALFASSAIAADIANKAKNSNAALETVVVIGKAPDNTKADLAGSVDVIGRDQLDIEHVDDTLELFNKAPGVYLSRYNQGIINTDLSIRGFAGDGSTPHGKLLIDNIPANLHNGYSEMDQLFPLAIDNIQLFKGTSDPRYGLYNIAGNYNVTSRSDVATQIQTTLGSFASREVQAYSGHEDGNLTHSYSMGYRESEGYRDHSDLEKYALSGRWFYQLSETNDIGFIARTSEYKADAPGYLDKTTAHKNPESSANYADRDGGEKSSDHLSVHYNSALTDSLNWQANAYWQTFERERWVRFSQAGALQDRYDDQAQYGAISTLNWQANEQWRLNWGMDIEQQDVVEQRFGTIGQTRVRNNANMLRNYDYTFNTAGSYLQAEHTLNEFVQWNIAYRVDKLSGNFTQTSAAGVKTDMDMYDFGWIGQPKFNLFISPTDTVTLFANAGRSFQHPFGSSAYTTGDTHNRDISINDGWETGVLWTPLEAFELRTSYWEQHATDEYVVVDGNAQNVGETERKGVDISTNWQLSEQLTVWANYSVIDTTIVTTDTANSNYTGNELRSIPAYTASLGLDLALTEHLSSKLHVDSQGDYYVNEANTGGKYGDYTLVGATFRYTTTWGAIDLQVNNLFDKYAEYVYDFTQTGTDTIHSPIDGRSISLSATWDL